MSDEYFWLPIRYQVHRVVQLVLPHYEPKWTVLVLIDDDEFWKGTPARRVPIRRDYLAVLIRTLSDCKPWVIALDFDFRSPAVDGSLQDNKLYQDETAKLVNAIEDASENQPIVLPKTIHDDHSATEPSFLDEIESNPDEVIRGNISLPYDYRQVPTSEFLGDHRQAVDSFALATAAVVNPKLRSKFPPDTDFPFIGASIPPRKFLQLHYRESSNFPNSDECLALRHKIVIVGAGWHINAYNRGPVVDTRDYTPMGRSVSAAFLHANYVEALLEDRTYPSLGKIPAVIVEILSSMLLALVLASKKSPSVRFAAVNAGLFVVALFLLTYIFAQNFGIFADFFFAVFFVLVHALWHYWGDLKLAQKERNELLAEVNRLRQSQLP